MDIRAFFKKDDEVQVVNQSGEEEVSRSTSGLKENKSSNVKVPAQKTKKRRWDDDYLKYGFYQTEDDKLSDYGGATCLFCTTKIVNSNLAPYHLSSHMNKKHTMHQNKSIDFFKRMRSDVQSASSQMKQFSCIDTDNILLASSEMTYVILQHKRPYTDLEKIGLPLLEIAAQRLHGGKQALQKVRKLPLSDTTVMRRSHDIADDLLHQVVDHLKKAPCYSLQMDESTDNTGEAQLLVFCKYPDEEITKVVERFLFCDKIGVAANSESIFNLVNSFIASHKLNWKKCCCVTTDGAPVMQGVRAGVVRKIQEVSPECASITCYLHREALSIKKFKDANVDVSELESVLKDVVKLVNYIKTKPKINRMFQEFCLEEEENDERKLLFHTEVRWLSKGKMLERVVLKRQELSKFLDSQHHELAGRFQDIMWLAKLCYLSHFFALQTS